MFLNQIGGTAKRNDAGFRQDLEKFQVPDFREPMKDKSGLLAVPPQRYDGKEYAGNFAGRLDFSRFQSTL